MNSDVNPDTGWDVSSSSSPTTGSNNADQHRWQRFLLRAINFYQVGREGRLSPCRFTPSCSEYSREAVEVHGAGRGIWLTARRLFRCRPFGPSGYDPVPELSSVTSVSPHTSDSSSTHHLTSPIARHPIGRSH